MRAFWQKLGAALSLISISGFHLVALTLRAWGPGRLLASVSIPRLREHQLRTALTTLGIALGVALLVSVLIVNQSIVRGVAHTIDHLAGKADLQIGAGASGFDEKLLDVAREVPGVYKLTPALQQVVTLHAPGGRRERLLLLGIDLLGNDDAYFRDYASGELEAIRRDPLAFLNSSTHFLVSRDLAERLGLSLHDKVDVSGPGGKQTFELWGFIDSGGVGRAFGGAMGVMYYPAMQVAFARGRNIDRIDVAVEKGTNPESVARALEAKLGRGFGVERPARRGERVDRMLTTVKITLTMSSFIALIAGAFLVWSTIAISIVQRRRELGVLRALGVTRKQVVRLLTLEGALLGIVGSAWGVAIGIAVAKSMLRLTGDMVDRIYTEQGAPHVQVDSTLLIFAAALGVGASVVAARLAAQRAAALRPADAWGPASALAIGAGSGRLHRSDLTAIVLVLLSAALVQLPPLEGVPLGTLVAILLLTLTGRALLPRLVRVVHAGLRLLDHRLLGVEAALARENLSRDLARTASTAAGLMAGVALTIAVGTFIASFITSLNRWTEQTVTGDLFVTSGDSISGLSAKNTPMSPALRSELAAIPGVQRVRPLRFVDIGFRDASVKLMATDTQLYFELSTVTPKEGTAAEIAQGLASGGVAISGNFASLYDLHRGDKLVLPAKDGERAFDIAGVIVDYTSDRGAILMDLATYVSAWDDDRVDTFEVHLKPGVALAQVRSSIDARLSETHDLFVLTNRAFRGEYVDAVSRLFELMRVLQVVTLVVAALGMLTALLANVLDRVREIGVLRAVGMLRARVRRLMLIEATFVGAVGTLAGLGVGLAIGYLLVRYVTPVQLGWELPYHFPGQAMLQLVLVTLPLSAIAGYWPARQAANLNVTEALDYE